VGSLVQSSEPTGEVAVKNLPSQVNFPDSTAAPQVDGEQWPYLEARRTRGAEEVAARRRAAELREGVGANELLARHYENRWECL
jgi:hypothetical protein